MIPKKYIVEWKEFVPWQNDAQIEQDMVIDRALISIFSDDYLHDNLAFRGGTALHKIYLKPQIRYSEDIDLVQIKKTSIGKVLDKIKEKLSFFDIKPIIKQKTNNNTLIFKFDSEISPVVRLRLKVEINCREHFNVLGFKNVEHLMKNGWFDGAAGIQSYELEELLATKLRALYQRKKGRDLFDLYYAMTKENVDFEKILFCYHEYMKFSVNKTPTANQFIMNMDEKIKNAEFTGDIYALLRPGMEFNNEKAYAFIKENLLEKM